ADRVLGLADVAGDAFVAFGADAGRPFDGRAGTDLALPVCAHLRQIVCEVEGRAGTVGAAHHGDRVRRQLQVRIELLDGRIIPLGDLAEIDVGERLAVEHHVAGLDAFEIAGR